MFLHTLFNKSRYLPCEKQKQYTKGGYRGQYKRVFLPPRVNLHNKLIDTWYSL